MIVVSECTAARAASSIFRVMEVVGLPLIAVERAVGHLAELVAQDGGVICKLKTAGSVLSQRPEVSFDEVKLVQRSHRLRIEPPGTVQTVQNSINQARFVFGKKSVC